MKTIFRKNSGLWLTLIVVLMSLNSLNAQNKSDTIIGIWELEDKSGKMEIFKKGEKYFGTLLWGKDVVNEDGSSKLDNKNPDLKLRGRNIIGITYIKNLEWNKDKWENGMVYDSSRGKWWNCYIELEKDKLHFTGYIGAKWLGQTVIYNRIK